MVSKAKAKANINITICIIIFLLLVSVVLIYLFNKKPTREGNVPRCEYGTDGHPRDRSSQIPLLWDRYDFVNTEYPEPPYKRQNKIDSYTRIYNTLKTSPEFFGPKQSGGEDYINRLYTTYYTWDEKSLPPVENDKTFMEQHIETKLNSLRESIHNVTKNKNRKFKHDLFNCIAYNLKKDFYELTNEKSSDNNDIHDYIFGTLTVKGKTKPVSDYIKDYKGYIDEILIGKKRISNMISPLYPIYKVYKFLVKDGKNYKDECSDFTKGVRDDTEHPIKLITTYTYKYFNRNSSRIKPNSALSKNVSNYIKEQMLNHENLKIQDFANRWNK